MLQLLVCRSFRAGVGSGGQPVGEAARLDDESYHRQFLTQTPTSIGVGFLMEPSAQGTTQASGRKSCGTC